MGDNRGKRYSAKRVSVGETDDTKETYWDFTFESMGTRDLEAFVRKIHELTDGGSRVIAYGQGFNQVIYGLT